MAADKARLVPQRRGSVAQHLLDCSAMVFSALVVTTDPRAIESERSALTREPSLTVGAPERNRIPVVVETETLSGGRQLFQQLRDREHVWSVDVVMIDFSEDHSDAAEVHHGA